jgi:hypothetical protein
LADAMSMSVAVQFDSRQFLTEYSYPRPLFFFHIPKTGGVALNATLENGFALDDCWPHLTKEDDRRFTSGGEAHRRFISGHTGPAAMAAAAGTHLRVTMLRHPVERFCSHVLHGFRHFRLGIVKDAYASVDDAFEALRAGEQQMFQNSYLCEVLGKPSYQPRWRVGERELDCFDVVAVAHQQRKLLHLLSHKCGMLPGFGNWKLNASSNREQIHALAGGVLDHLDEFQDDLDTFSLAEERFNQQYDTFVEQLFEEVSNRGIVTDDMVEHRLLQRHLNRLGKLPAADGRQLEMTGAQPGHGWWWRECNERLAYRWLGPELESVAYLPPLVRRDYDLTIELVAIASGRILSELSIRVGSHHVEHQFEVVSDDPLDVKYVLRGVVRAGMLPGEGRPLTLRIVCPETIPTLVSQQIAYSSSTTGHDARPVSLAIARVNFEPRAV